MTVQDSARQTEVYNDVLSFDQAFVGSLAVTTVSAYNPVTEVETKTTVSYPAACVFKKITKNEAIPDNFVISDTQNYRGVIYAGLGVVPDKDDVLTMLGQTYSIMGAIESSGGDNSLFTVYVRKGI